MLYTTSKFAIYCHSAMLKFVLAHCSRLFATEANKLQIVNVKCEMNLKFPNVFFSLLLENTFL